MQPTTSAPTRSTRSARSALLRAAAAGGFAALSLTTAAYGLAHLTGDDLLVAPSGQPRASVTLAAVVTAVLVASVGNLGLALLAARSRRGYALYLAVATTVLALSLLGPAGAAVTITSALWLCVFHATTAAGLMPFTARWLRSAGPRTPAP
nr:hypothetical protein [uncultured bacterium]